METGTNAEPVTKVAADENEGKTMNLYFGVFFDVRRKDSWLNSIIYAKEKAENMVSDVKDSEIYKISNLVNETLVDIFKGIDKEADKDWSKKLVKYGNIEQFMKDSMDDLIKRTFYKKEVDEKEEIEEEVDTTLQEIKEKIENQTIAGVSQETINALLAGGCTTIQNILDLTDEEIIERVGLNTAQSTPDLPDEESMERVSLDQASVDILRSELEKNKTTKKKRKRTEDEIQTEKDKIEKNRSLLVKGMEVWDKTAPWIDIAIKADDKAEKANSSLYKKGKTAVTDFGLYVLSGMKLTDSETTEELTTSTGRSIISKMEASYGLKEHDESNEAFRIYTQGSLWPSDLKPKEDPSKPQPENADATPASENTETTPEADKEKDAEKKKWSKEAAEEALKVIKDKIFSAPPAGVKVSVHLDIFGYEKDDSIENLESESDTLMKEFSNITEINIDYKGAYKQLNDPEEVKKSLGGAKERFKNTKFLGEGKEKNK